MSASNYLTTLSGVRPASAGLEFRVVETGSRLELTNRSSIEAVVLGYQDEPYLRVGPAGVFENQRSPATYLNASREGGAPIPTDADPESAPRWKKISDGNVARWHDHRAHWMGAQDPPAVSSAPGRRHVIYPKWEVKIRHGARDVVATGQLLWIPGGSPIPWFAGTLTLLLVVAGVCLGFGLRAIAVSIAILVAVDVAHSVAIAWAVAAPLPGRIGILFASSYMNVVTWAVGVVAIRPCWRRDELGLMPAAIAGAFIALFGGLLDLSGFWKSQIPFALPSEWARVMVSAIVGIGLGTASATGLKLYRSRSLAPLEDDIELAPPGPVGT